MTSFSSVRALLAPLFALLCACSVYAEEAEWLALEAAQKESARSDKPVFLVVVLNHPYCPKDYPDRGWNKIRETATGNDDAASFEKAMINVGRTNVEDAKKGGSGWTPNAALVEKYGTVGTVAMYAPGASVPMWKEENGALSDDVFKRAREFHTTWRKSIDDLEQKLKEDKELKKDPAFLAQLGEAWAAGRSGANALKNLDSAIKLVKKADKADANIEKWTLQAADVALDCEDFADAIKRYDAYLKDFEDNANAPHAQLGRAKTLLKSGDPKGAIKALAEINKEAPQPVLDEAEKLLEQARATKED